MNPPPFTLAEKRAAIVAEIRALERDEQARALREFALDMPGAAARLAALDERIAVLRKELSALPPST